MTRSAMSRRVVLGVVTGAAASPTEAQTNYDTPVGALDGVWHGDLGPVSGRGITPAQMVNLRIQIDRETARVFVGPDDAREEIKPGTFRIQRDGTNAVITSIEVDPGRPRNEGWVETWSFAATLYDAERLTTHFVRVVNNNDLPPDARSSRFSMICTGELRRLSSDV